MDELTRLLNRGEGGAGSQEEREKVKEEEPKRNRPRWPPRPPGLRPEVEWSLKERLRGAARLWLDALGTEGAGDERALMNGMARCMAREGLPVFKPRPRMLLTDLGAGSFFRTEPNRTYESESDEEGSAQDTTQLELSDVEDYIPECGRPACEEATDYTEGPQTSLHCQVDSTPAYSVNGSLEEHEGHWDMEGLKGETEGKSDAGLSSGYPHSSSPGELSGGWEGTSAGITSDQRPSGSTEETAIPGNSEGDPECPKTKQDRQKRHISWITLVCSGESTREELGYGCGWTEYADDGMSAGGRRAVEEAGKALLERGAKFDLAITSSLTVDRQATDLVLYSVGQDSLRRWTSWELNPRHLGAEEGRVRAGTDSRCGWLTPKMWSEVGPPAIDPGHVDWCRQVDQGRTTGEGVLNLQARTKRLWTFVVRLIDRGRRSVLLVCREEVVKALLHHALGLQPWDFGQWSPRWPLLLVYERKGRDMGLAAVDFAAPDTREQATFLHRAMLERHFDSGILDKYAMAELKDRAEKGRNLPTIDDIYRYKRGEADKWFERGAEEAGERERILEGLAALGQRRLLSERTHLNLEGKAA